VVYPLSFTEVICFVIGLIAVSISKLSVLSIEGIELGFLQDQFRYGFVVGPIPLQNQITTVNS
jgi:hypothetical protein